MKTLVEVHEFAAILEDRSEVGSPDLSGAGAVWRQRSGLSLVELLIVMAVVGIILGVVVAFFSQQTALSRRIQAQNEVQVRVRAVAEAIAQDFQLAGARAVTDAAGRSRYVDRVNELCTTVVTGDDGEDEAGPRDRCVVTGAGFDMSVVYASSLWVLPGESVNASEVLSRACRLVEYYLDTSERALYRSDVPCPQTLPGRGTYTPDFEDLFASGVSDVTLLFVCEDQSEHSDPQECFTNGGFVREVQVTVTGQTARGGGLQDAVTLTAYMPNMRPPATFIGGQ